MKSQKRNVIPLLSKLEINDFPHVPIELRNTVIRACQESISMHGIDPCTLDQAAAHEAGHIIVGHCIGETIIGAKLFRKKILGFEEWVGSNQRTSIDDAAFTVQENPYFGFKAAINNLSGWTGELIAKLSHESSSIDEREIAREIIQTLDRTLGLKNGTSAMFVTSTCIACITKNRLQFDVIRMQLSRNGRLTREEAKRMLIKTTLYDIETAFNILKNTAL